MIYLMVDHKKFRSIIRSNVVDHKVKHRLAGLANGDKHHLTNLFLEMLQQVPCLLRRARKHIGQSSSNSQCSHTAMACCTLAHIRMMQAGSWKHTGTSNKAEVRGNKPLDPGPKPTRTTFALSTWQTTFLSLSASSVLGLWDRGRYLLACAADRWVCPLLEWLLGGSCGCCFCPAGGPEARRSEPQHLESRVPRQLPNSSSKRATKQRCNNKKGH